MRNVLCINATAGSEYLSMPLSDGETCSDRLGRYVESLADMDERVLLCRRGAPAPFTLAGARTVEMDELSASNLVRALSEAGKGADHLVYVHGDCPFLDPAVTGTMLAKHVQYFAEYTFADGFPVGITPEILRVSALPLLQKLADEGSVPYDRSTIFGIVQRDINSFDIETELAPQDMRMLRLSLSCDLRRNYLLCRNFARAGATDAGSVMKIAIEQGELQRTVPAFVNVQILDGCPQACSYCAFPQFGGDILGSRNEMPVDRFAAIVDRVEEFAPSSVISISLWGEPSLHSRIAEIVNLVEASETLSLIIETSGVGWSDATLSALANANLKRTTWIVSLDADEVALYRRLRGDGFEEATATAQRLVADFPGKTYVQAVRMNENEEHLEEFFRHWKQEPGQVIIQKYDHFSRLLPERKVTDLSPLKRFPCWHIKRDLTVRLDGTVTQCREDVHATSVWGNLFEEDLETIWARGESLYRSHLRGEYPGMCAGCDEYYTFNN